MAQMRVFTGTLLAIGLGLGIAGCGFRLASLLPARLQDEPETTITLPRSYNPGICSRFGGVGTDNPTNSTQYSDTIQYESIDLSTSFARAGSGIG